MILAGTGHRPPRLGLDYSKDSRKWLINFVLPHLKELCPAKVISGGAQGFDQALAGAAYLLDIPFIVAVPFKGQEKKWPAPAQDSYRKMCSLAEEVVVVCEGGYANSKFIERDKWMVDHADKVVALYDGQGKSGTGATVEYAIKQEKEIFNLWDSWINR